MPDLNQIKQGEQGARDRRLHELKDASKVCGGPHCRGEVTLALQPIGECLLVICCRCSHVK